jgi:hypothetical protein
MKIWSKIIPVYAINNAYFLTERMARQVDVLYENAVLARGMRKIQNDEKSN